MSKIVEVSVEKIVFPPGADPRMPAGIFAGSDFEAGDASGGTITWRFALEETTTLPIKRRKVFFAVASLSISSSGAQPSQLARVNTVGFSFDRVFQATEAFQRRNLNFVDSPGGVAALWRDVQQNESLWPIGFPRAGNFAHRIEIITDNVDAGVFYQADVSGLFWLADAADQPHGPQMPGSDLDALAKPNFGTGQDSFYGKLRRGEEPVVQQSPLASSGGRAIDERDIAVETVSRIERQQRATRAGDFGVPVQPAAVAASRTGFRGLAGAGARALSTDRELIDNIRAQVLTAPGSISLQTAAARALGQSVGQVSAQVTASRGKSIIPPGARFANIGGRFEE